MFGAISKAMNKVRDKFESLVNEEELKAVVSAAVLVAAADGKVSDEEKKRPSRQYRTMNRCAGSTRRPSAPTSTVT